MDNTIFHPLDKHQIDTLDTKMYPWTWKIHLMDMAVFHVFFQYPCSGRCIFDLPWKVFFWKRSMTDNSAEKSRWNFYFGCCIIMMLPNKITKICSESLLRRQISGNGGVKQLFWKKKDQNRKIRNQTNSFFLNEMLFKYSQVTWKTYYILKKQTFEK